MVSVSSAQSVDAASEIQSPPKKHVADLYQNNVRPDFIFYTDRGKRTVVPMTKNGRKEPAVHLRPGAAGFLVAIFEDGMELESELPNALAKEPSQPVVKPSGLKRPAAAVGLAALLEPAPCAVPAAVASLPAAVETAAVAAVGPDCLTNFLIINLSTEVVPMLNQFAKWSKLNWDHPRKDK